MTSLLGTIIRTGRSAAGLTQQALADQVKVSRAAVGQWEAGTHEPSTENLIAVCQALGVDVESAIRGEYKVSSHADSPKTSALGALTEQDRFRLLGGLNEAYKKNKNRDMTRLIPLYIGTLHDHPPYTYLSAEPFTGTSRPYALDSIPDVYSIIIPDDFLEPKFSKDDFIFVSSKQRPAIGDYVVVKTGIINEIARPEGGEGIQAERCLLGKMVGYDIFGTKIQQHNPPRVTNVPSGAGAVIHRIFEMIELIPMLA